MAVVRNGGSIRIYQERRFLKALLIVVVAAPGLWILFNLPEGFEIRELYFVVSPYVETFIRAVIVAFLLFGAFALISTLWLPAMVIDERGIGFGAMFLRRRYSWEDIQGVSADEWVLTIFYRSPRDSNQTDRTGSLKMSINRFWPLNAPELQEIILKSALEFRDKELAKSGTESPQHFSLRSMSIWWRLFLTVFLGGDFFRFLLPVRDN